VKSENIKALVEYRLEQAKESLKASELLLTAGMVRPSVSRAYYAMFYAVLALLATRKKESSKHGGVISLFDKEYIKPGIFPKDFSKWLHDAFNLRQRSDYMVPYIPSAEEAEQVIVRARTFLDAIRKQLEIEESI